MPALGAVMVASIFIASIVATVCAGLDGVALGDAGVTTPANGAATCPGLAGSAFSAADVGGHRAVAHLDRGGTAR